MSDMRHSPIASGGAAAEAAPQPDPAHPTRILLVTGMSGAGKTAALKGVEDMGFEAVDNLPLSFLSSIVNATPAGGRALAIGIDIRTRDFAVEPLVAEIDALMARPELKVSLLFLDCEDEVLRRRFSETRRRHPLAADRPVTDGIERERRLVTPLRDRADVVIDTSNLPLPDLRRQLSGHFALDVESGLALFVTSFSYRHGIPREADLVFDVRFLDNPHYDERLRPMTGADPSVAAFIERDPGFAPFFAALTALLEPLLPRYAREGKSYLTIAFGCTGGRHRSVFLAERLAGWLSERGHHVGLAHRDA
jgi:UPF0042 nucleotide-binding protein